MELRIDFHVQRKRVRFKPKHRGALAQSNACFLFATHRCKHHWNVSFLPARLPQEISLDSVPAGLLPQLDFPKSKIRRAFGVEPRIEQPRKPKTRFFFDRLTDVIPTCAPAAKLSHESLHTGLKSFVSDPPPQNMKKHRAFAVTDLTVGGVSFRSKLAQWIILFR